MGGRRVIGTQSAITRDLKHKRSSENLNMGFSDDLCVYQIPVRRILANDASDIQTLMKKRRLKLIFRRRLSFMCMAELFRFLQ